MAKRTEAGEPLHLITNAGAATRGSDVPTAISADLARRSRLRADGVHAGLPIMDSVLLPGSREWHVEAIGLYSVLDKGLETALSLMEADRGTMQIPDPATGSLRIAVQAGFSAEFLQYFARVDDDTSACGRAASQRAQMVIADVNADSGFARHRDIAAASRFRAVQSTPLVDIGGRLVGVLSTHYPRPYRPPARDLEIMQRYGELIGQAIGACLNADHDLDRLS